MRNYFNYFTEIEQRFTARRGSILLLSTLDWALIETWREAGVPLEAVLRGIDAAFDKYDARLTKSRGRMRKVNGLAWCAQAVMQATEEMHAAAIGGTNTPAKEPQDSGFEYERIAAYLTINAAALEAASTPPAPPAASVLKASEEVAGSPEPRRSVSESAEAIASIAGRLRAMADEILDTRTADNQSLETTLTALEQRLFAALTLSATEEESIALREQAARELAPYRGKMSAVQLKQVTDQFLHKRLLDARNLPRLSLFYMSLG